MKDARGWVHDRGDTSSALWRALGKRMLVVRGALDHEVMFDVRPVGTTETSSGLSHRCFRDRYTAHIPVAVRELIRTACVDCYWLLVARPVEMQQRALGRLVGVLREIFLIFTSDLASGLVMLEIIAIPFRIMPCCDVIPMETHPTLSRPHP